MKTHSSLDVGNYIIKKAEERKNSLTPMQVIKLVYLCHGWMLGLYNRPLISESVEAWQYGPVIKDLYLKVKTYGSDPVVGPIGNDDEYFDEDEKSVINQVIDQYSILSGPALSRLTHAKGTPWNKTWAMSMNSNAVISNDLIEDHFQHLYNKSTGL